MCSAQAGCSDITLSMPEFMLIRHLRVAYRQYNETPKALDATIASPDTRYMPV